MSPAVSGWAGMMCAFPCLQVQPGDLYITLWDSIPVEWINEV